MVLFEAMEENLRATMAVFGRARPDGQSRQLPGVAATSSAVQFAMFNSAMLTTPVATPAELDERIEYATAYFSELGLPWSFWVCQGWIAGPARSKVGAVFERRQMRLVVELPGMETASVSPPSRPLPELEFRAVCDAPSRADFAYLMSAAFGIPMAIAREIYESERTWECGLTGWLAYRDSAPISSAATMVTSSTLGVYAIGTLPPHRGRGYAEAVMRHAMDQAGGPFERTLLQSSEAGYALYRRMGYRTSTRYAVFAT